jgi:hypothetical protein
MVLIVKNVRFVWIVIASDWFIEIIEFIGPIELFEPTNQPNQLNQPLTTCYAPYSV